MGVEIGKDLYVMLPTGRILGRISSFCGSITALCERIQLRVV